MLKRCPSTPLHKKCIDIIIERDKASGKIGRVSKSLGGKEGGKGAYT